MKWIKAITAIIWLPFFAVFALFIGWTVLPEECFYENAWPWDRIFRDCSDREGT